MAERGTSLRMTGDEGTGNGKGEKVTGARIGHHRITVVIVARSGSTLKHRGNRTCVLVFHHACRNRAIESGGWRPSRQCAAARYGDRRGATGRCLPRRHAGVVVVRISAGG